MNKQSKTVFDDQPVPPGTKCWWAVGEGDNCPNDATHYESDTEEDDGTPRPTCDSCCGNEPCARHG